VTPDTAPAHDHWSWEAMTEEFRALGGAVKNIAPGEHGLIAIDPAEPVLVRVPHGLLVRTEDIVLEDQKILLRESAGLSDPLRRFFERYANAVNLHAAREAEVASRVMTLAALPDNVRQALANDLGLAALLQDDTGRAIQSGLLKTRQIAWQGGPAIVPIMELARYDPEGLRPERGTNLQIQGYAAKEVFVRYGPQDAFSAFRRFGCALPETAAFSLPSTVTIGQVQFDIGVNLGEGTRRGNDRVPTIARDADKVSLSYLLLGDRRSPALPRSIFRTLMTESGINNPDEVFDLIVRSNALRFIRLLQNLEPYEGEMISTLRTVARYQLEAISHCVGSRKIAPAPSASPNAAA